MAIDNLPLFSAMNKEEVKPPFPHPHRPMTSQEDHFAIMQRVNSCIHEVNKFEQRVQFELESYFAKTTTANEGFKEAIQSSYNAFMQVVQNEINNFETSMSNNNDLFKNDVDKRIADFETAINNEYRAFVNSVNSIVTNFKTQVENHMQEQDVKIEQYKDYMADNILQSTEFIFNKKVNNGEIASVMASVYGSGQTFKGSLTYDEIHNITNANNGDYYYCTNNDHYYRYAQSSWVDVGTGDKIVADYLAFKEVYLNDKTVSADHITKRLANIGFYGDIEELEFELLDGYINATGVDIEGTDNIEYKHSNYIEVVPNETMFVSTFNGMVGFAINFYDENKMFIGGILQNTSDGKVYTNEKFVTPKNCYFVRLNSIYPNGVKPHLTRYTVKNMGETMKRIINGVNNKNISHLKLVETSDININSNSYIDKFTGEYTDTTDADIPLSESTDFINVADFDILYVTARAYGYTCNLSLFDEHQNFICSYGKNNANFGEEGYTKETSWNLEKISSLDITLKHPNCKYIKLCSIYTSLRIYKGVEWCVADTIKELSNNQKIVSKYTDITSNYTTMLNHYVDKGTGIPTELEYHDNLSSITDFIEITDDIDLYVTGRAKAFTCVIAFYDKNKQFLRSYGYNEWWNIEGQENPELILNRFHVNKDFIDSVESNAKYVRFGSYIYNLVIETGEYLTPQQAFDYKQGKEWSNLTWCVWGDSLTENNFRTTKHYFDYIAEETGITTLNYGVGGSGYMEHSGGVGNEWITRINTLENVDFDVITLFGSGNDLHETLNATMGTATDTGTDTLGGCINTTLDRLLAIKPLAKIGIITPVPWIGNTPNDHGTMEKYSDLLIEIAKNRSIPCLDLFRCSTLNPNSDAHNLAFFSCDVSPNGDGVHPNTEGHKRFYPMVREFLKTLI